MILSTLLDQINITYRGTDDDAPTVGTPDYSEWLGTINRKLGEYARDTQVTRESLFEVRSIGNVTAGTQAYDLDDDFINPSDKVIVTTTLGSKVEYTIDKPQERGRSFRSVYISGRNPQTLTFYDTITAIAQIVGGAISLGGYFLPDDLANANDTVPVDDPFWMVYSVASELAFNDLTYSAKAPDLVAKANNLWTGMVTSNRRGTGDNPRRARTNVVRIGSTEGRL